MSSRVFLPALALAVVGAMLTAPVCAAVGVGDKAPDFTLVNVSGQGSTKLLAAEGKATLLVFWTTWCPHCTREVPVLQQLYSDLKDKGLVVVGVSLDNDMAEPAKFVKNNRITFLTTFDGTSAGHTIAGTYGVRGVPALFVIDSKGIVRYTHVGETERGTIRSELAQLGVK